MKRSQSSVSTKSKRSASAGKRSASSAKPKPSRSKRNPKSDAVEQYRKLVSSSLSETAVVMGLDLSLTGLGLVVATRNKIIRKRLFKTEGLGPKFKDGQRRGRLPSGKFRGSDEERIEFLRKQVAANLRKFSPELVVVEGYSFGSKGRGLSIIHELGGVVKGHMHRKGVRFEVVAPPTNKKAFTGSGTAKKEHMISVAQDYDPTITDDNIADALALCRYFLD